MSLPLDALNLAQRELGLVAASVLGFGFGFVLERAGLGRATRLAAQFYLTDMTVLKVMFSAIVTAMLGLQIAAGIGLTDLSVISRSIASWSWIWPMLLGGFVLGVGFIISGYCPGTSIVAAGSGNLDGMVAFCGVVAGSFLYNLLLELPAFASFHSSGEIGASFLYELLDVPAPVLGSGVALIAILALVAAEKIEAIMRRRRDGAGSPELIEQRPRRFAFATFGVLGLISIALLGLPQGSRAAGAPRTGTITAEDLARRVIDEPWSVRIIDLRTPDAFAASRIPTSENAAVEKLGALGLDLADPAKELVLVTPTAAVELPLALGAYRGSVLMLKGGWPAWKSFALDTPALPAATASAKEREIYAFRSALNASLTGQKPAPVVSAPAHGDVPRVKQKGGGCST